jgi:hypothetical protein
MHNTVTVNNQNSSQVWSAFRVGKRARVKILEENNHFISVRHDGYRQYATIHQRDWSLDNSSLQITDHLIGKKEAGRAHFWLAPGTEPREKDHHINLGLATMQLEKPEAVKIIKKQIPQGYNQYIDTWKIEVTFAHTLKTTLTIHEK